VQAIGLSKQALVALSLKDNTKNLPYLCRECFVKEGATFDKETLLRILFNDRIYADELLNNVEDASTEANNYREDAERMYSELGDIKQRIVGRL
jgi:hypothetical protein